jgi:FixJ family two-component response regulator
MPQHPLISIVEDDQLFRESMKKLVRLLGYTVETFPSAADFLASPLLPEMPAWSPMSDAGMTGVELHKIIDAGYAIPTISSPHTRMRPSQPRPKKGRLLP